MQLRRLTLYNRNVGFRVLCQFVQENPDSASVYVIRAWLPLTAFSCSLFIRIQALGTICPELLTAWSMNKWISTHICNLRHIWPSLCETFVVRDLHCSVVVFVSYFSELFWLSSISHLYFSFLVSFFLLVYFLSLRMSKYKQCTRALWIYISSSTINACRCYPLRNCDRAFAWSHCVIGLCLQPALRGHFIGFVCEALWKVNVM